MTKLNLFLVGILSTLAIVTAIVLATPNDPENWEWRREPVTEKFGQMPNNDAVLEPIVHLLNDKKIPYCTAFVIDKNYAITSGHCVKENGDLTKKKLGFSDSLGVNLNVEVTAKGY